MFPRCNNNIGNIPDEEINDRGFSSPQSERRITFINLSIPSTFTVHFCNWNTNWYLFISSALPIVRCDANSPVLLQKVANRLELNLVKMKWHQFCWQSLSIYSQFPAWLGLSRDVKTAYILSRHEENVYLHMIIVAWGLLIFLIMLT